jgi:hypothetical protein
LEASATYGSSSIITFHIVSGHCRSSALRRFEAAVGVSSWPEAITSATIASTTGPRCFCAAGMSSTM